jgi:hypothetical protein
MRFSLLLSGFLFGCVSHPSSVEKSQAAVETLGDDVAWAPAPAMTWRNDSFDELPGPHLFDRDVRGHLYEKSDRWWYEPQASNDWKLVTDDPIQSKPSATSWRDRMDVFALRDGKIVQNTRTSTKGMTWSGWTAIPAVGGPGSFMSAPAATSHRAGVIEVVAWGTDLQLWHTKLDGGGAWTEWASLGTAPSGATEVEIIQKPTLPPIGKIATVLKPPIERLPPPVMSTPIRRLIPGDPAAASSDHRLDVFFRGSDGSLKHRGRVDGAWASWESLGGRLTSAPTATASANGSIRVYARDISKNIAYRLFNNTWSDWLTIPGPFTSGPSAVASSLYECDHLTARDAAGDLWYRHCGERSSVSFTAGATVSDKGLLPGRTWPFNFNTSLNALSGDTTDVVLEARWPRELILLDRSDSKDSVPLPGTPAHYATLGGYTPGGGLSFGPDFGPYAKGATFPFAVKASRLVDHGACVATRGWFGGQVDGRYRPGLFEVMRDKIADTFKARAATFNGAAFPLVFQVEPVFVEDPNARRPSDGFHLHVAYKFLKSDAEVVVDVLVRYAFNPDASFIELHAVDGVITVSQNGWADFFEFLGAFDGVKVMSIHDNFVIGLPRMLRNAARDQASSLREFLWRCPAIDEPRPDTGAPYTDAESDAFCNEGRNFMNFALVPELEKTMSSGDAIRTANDWVGALGNESFSCERLSKDEKGYCHWTPRFRRTNVLPEGIELVWYDRERTVDFEIVKLLRADLVEGCAPAGPPPLDTSPKTLRSF